MRTRSASILKSCLASGALLACALTTGAAADDLIYDDAKQNGAVSVRDRTESSFRPDGIRIGNYLYFPWAGYVVTYDSNILSSGINQIADYRHELRMAMNFESHLPRHMFDLSLGGTAVMFQEFSDINHLDGYAASRWRIDIDHADSITGFASTNLEHEENVTEEAPLAAAEPVQDLHNKGEIALRRDGGRLYGAIGTRAESWNYDNVKAYDGSIIEQDSRDVAILSPFVSLGYRFSPGYNLTAEVVSHTQWNRGTEKIDRDAQGYEALAGIEMELTTLLKAEIKGGWQTQDFKQDGLADIDAAIWSAELQWLITPMLTLTFNARRSVYATTYGESSGRLDTQFGGRADYEMWRNLILTAGFEYRDSDFVGSDRLDSIYVGHIGAEYAYTKNIFLTVDYEHQLRQSTVSDYDVEKDKISIGGKIRF